MICEVSVGEGVKFVSNYYVALLVNCNIIYMRINGKFGINKVIE